MRHGVHGWVTDVGQTLLAGKLLLPLASKGGWGLGVEPCVILGQFLPPLDGCQLEAEDVQSRCPGDGPKPESDSGGLWLEAPRALPSLPES